ncbi:7433_t:CDS:10 [Ambispora gerdemannii]|uniref:Ubiquitin-like modifier-activating enzyme ATG7 n=1 Tax=Ambispora gerdemannii TaxID=144530 RepID=A0A9N8WUC9_9GLOM|nr:7433_t:CDS:10 [Ambispora gerdemannii]
MTSHSPPLVQFVPFSSAVEAPFWHTLSTRKIDLYKLDDTPQNIVGYYSTGHTLTNSKDLTEVNVVLPSRLCLGTGAFDSDEAIGSLPPFTYPSVGTVKITNTIEEFKSLDKQALFKTTTEQIWNDIVSGKAIENPSLLTRFLLITFADLKKYKYHYWFAFPAFLTDPAWVIGDNGKVSGIEVWNQDEIQSFRVNFEKFSQVKVDRNSGFFLIKERILEDNKKEIVVGSLSEWETFFEGLSDDERIVGFVDPSSLPTNPGWPLRNFLVLLHRQWHVKKIKVLCYREIVGKKDISQSIFLTVELPTEPKISDEGPKAVGWEKNAQGKLGPRTADLAPLMSPESLADTSVDLNLKLMRWRIVPSLDLEKIRDTKCLLLGAGTLGCYVARTLLGWGVRNITFVDNSRVSFSNPVRQPLFFFEDCLDGGKPKAQTAAENLKKIYPGVNSEGYEINIPMPGHPISTLIKAQKDVNKLTQLIQSHDVIFLLTDSRESRWLPTLMGASMQKQVINVALGFDTYLVMRHGVKSNDNTNSEKKATNEAEHSLSGVKQLGCYFCNDVVAPTDSLKDRTLDQQCTVTRPGLAPIAGALAVELMVSVLHHEKGAAAPAHSNLSISESLSSVTDSPLGIIPHQIRGFLTHFNNMIIVGQAYNRCTACSDIIIDEYRKHGFDFLLRVFNSSSDSYLEEVTGLAQLHADSEVAGDFVWDEEDEDSKLE